MEIPCCSFISNSLWLFFFYLVFTSIRGVYRYCLRKGKDLKATYSQGNDTYACVTGATSGIGKGFAFELASRGFNVLLVSRSESKLKAVQEELKSKYPGLLFDYVVSDFGENQSLQFYEDICAKINKFDIGLLVNNAGIMHIGRFNDIEAQQHLQVMEVNMLPYTMVTRYILPKMMNRNARSGIVMVSSLGIQASCAPVNAIYMATKAFDDSFARGLAYEVQDKVDILSLKPGYVESNLSKKKKGLDAISGQESASSTLNQLGFRTATSGHWSHEILSIVLDLSDHLPSFIHNLLYNKMLTDLANEIKKKS